MVSRSRRACRKGEALALAESLAGLEKISAAVSAAKRAVRHGMDAPLGRGLEMEERLAVRVMGGR